MSPGRHADEAGIAGQTYSKETVTAYYSLGLHT